MSTKFKTLTRELIKRSTNDHGAVEYSLVEEVLSSLREISPARHKEILKDYLNEIRKILRKQIVEIELGCESNESFVSKIKNKIDSTNSNSYDLQVSRNDQLIAGYRVRLVDDVFEDSVQTRLSKLSQSLTS